MCPESPFSADVGMGRKVNYKLCLDGSLLDKPVQYASDALHPILKAALSAERHGSP